MKWFGERFGIPEVRRFFCCCGCCFCCSLCSCSCRGQLLMQPLRGQLLLQERILHLLLLEIMMMLLLLLRPELLEIMMMLLLLLKMLINTMKFFTKSLDVAWIGHKQWMRHCNEGLRSQTNAPSAMQWMTCTHLKP